MRERLVRVVLALYPRPVRERYGAEIADLLAHSRRPARDLADAVSCALTERAFALTWPGLRQGATTTVTLLAVPAALAGATLAAVATALMVIQAVAPGADPRAVSSVSALAAAPVAALALWWGRRMGRVSPIAAPAVVVPAAHAIAITLMWMIPVAVLPGDSVAQTMRATGPATAVWWTALTVVTLAAGRLRARGRTGTATLVAIVGGWAALELSTVTAVLSTVDAATAPRGYAPLWFAQAVSGVDPGGEIIEAVGVLPTILTLCTVFALALTLTPTRHPARPLPA